MKLCMDNENLTGDTDVRTNFLGAQVSKPLAWSSCLVYFYTCDRLWCNIKNKQTCRKICFRWKIEASNGVFAGYVTTTFVHVVRICHKRKQMFIFSSDLNVTCVVIVGMLACASGKPAREHRKWIPITCIAVIAFRCCRRRMFRYDCVIAN